MIIQIYWLVNLRNPSSFFNFGPIRRPKTLHFRNSEDSPNFQILGSMLLARCRVVYVVLSQIKKADEQNFPYFHTCRLINKINRLYEQNCTKLFKKIDKSVLVHQKELTMEFLTMELLKLLKQASLTRRSTTLEQKRSFQNFGPKNFFSWVLPLLDVRHCCKLPFYPISKKPNDPDSKNGEKPHFEPVLGPLAPKLGLKIWFSKIWLRQFLDIMVSS